MIRLYILLSVLLIIISSCKQKTNSFQYNMEAHMDQFSDQDIQNLSKKRIFFGHMSVGYNIIDGLKDLKREDQRLSDFSIVEMTENIKIQNPGFYHKKNGKNGFPETKCDAFKSFLRKDSLGTQFEIALFKFCYVDIVEDSDVKTVFEYYVQTIDEIKNMFPKLKIIHVTTPLMAHNFSLKNRIKNILTGDLANVRRNQFNILILDNYSDLDTIFDLAKLESTYPDQKREFFTYKGDKYYALIKDYAYDEGHLNEMGRKWIAAEFLKALLEE